MDVHKPKAAHGWRELASEIGIIVVGVLIALTAEQIADALHWRHKVAEAESAMRLELVGDDMPQAYVRLAIAPCLGDRLQAMRAVIRPGMRTADFTPLADAYTPPLRSWDSDAWRVGVAGDVGAHMPPERMLRWASAYVMVPSLDADQQKEADGLHELVRSRFRQGVLERDDARRLGDAIDDLGVTNKAIAGKSLRLLMGGADMGLHVSGREQERLLAQAREEYGTCATRPNLEVAHTFTSDVSSKDALGYVGALSHDGPKGK